MAETRSSGPRRTIGELLDDDVAHYTVVEWRHRNLDLYELLAERKLIDTDLVSPEVHRFLTESLIQARVGAATDPQNAGHVRAQNENVLHFALAAQVSPAVLTIALESGYIHDLNKALGEPLRSDRFAVKDGAGRIVPSMTTMAQIVGLNHLGERTRRTIFAATKLPARALAPEIAEKIDRCIVHHGLGSSRFIRDLIDGHNAWWGSEFVNADGERLLVHPEQPEPSLESLIHDLADSTQQMQGGAAWFMKYPAGFWAGLGRTYAEMVSGRDVVKRGEIAVSLYQQIEAETATCMDLIDRAEETSLIDANRALSLRIAVSESARSSVTWLDDSPIALAAVEGTSVYHAVGKALGIAPVEARKRLGEVRPGEPEADRLEELIWISGQALDHERALELAAQITDC